MYLNVLTSIFDFNVLALMHAIFSLIMPKIYPSTVHYSLYVWKRW